MTWFATGATLEGMHQVASPAAHLHRKHLSAALEGNVRPLFAGNRRCDILPYHSDSRLMPSICLSFVSLQRRWSVMPARSDR